MTKPILLLDQDGPLAHFDAHFHAMVAENGWPMDATLETQTARFATDHIPDLVHRKRARRVVNTSGWFRALPVTEGAQEGIQILDKHFEVWIVTKPLEANPSCRDEKAAWVVEHLGRKWERRLILTPDKSMVNGHLLLDDAPKSEWYERATWRPVIFSTVWNGRGSAWEGLPRWTWGDDVEILLSLARTMQSLSD